MYQLNQTLPVSADFPDREVVTVASWDHQPTRDELIALDLTPVTADTILRVGHNGGKVPFLRLEHFPEKPLDSARSRSIIECSGDATNAANHQPTDCEDSAYG